MGRRKKEPAGAHRERITAAAEKLFSCKGITATSMDEIAREAGYSKATLYVYFQNKEEIVGILTLESMKKLHGYFTAALQSGGSIREKYDAVCQALLRYSEEFPFYFQTVLGGINIDMEHSKCPKEDRETFRIGEEINLLLLQFFKEGVERNVFRSDLSPLPTLFSFWGALSGVIQLAANKETYILQELKQTRKEFITAGFDMLYRSIAKEENT